MYVYIYSYVYTPRGTNMLIRAWHECFINVACQIWRCRIDLTHSHGWHVTCKCLTYKHIWIHIYLYIYITLQIWKWHITCYTCLRDTSHMCYVTHVNAPYHTREPVTHDYVTHINVTCHTLSRVTSSRERQVCARHKRCCPTWTRHSLATHTCTAIVICAPWYWQVTCNVYDMCDISHSHVWCDIFTCVTGVRKAHELQSDMDEANTRYTHMHDYRAWAYVWHDSFTCVICRIHMCDMMYWCVWQVCARHTRCSSIWMRQTLATHTCTHTHTHTHTHTCTITVHAHMRDIMHVCDV